MCFPLSMWSGSIFYYYVNVITTLHYIVYINLLSPLFFNVKIASLSMFPDGTNIPITPINVVCQLHLNGK